jgi:hypothetical protein
VEKAREKTPFRWNLFSGITEAVKFDLTFVQ